MKYTLPRFAWVCLPVLATCSIAAAQLPTAQRTASPAPRSTPAPARRDSISGDELLERVLATVDAQTSIAARLRYQINLKDRTALGSGSYLQQGRGAERLFRLELDLKTPPTVSRLRHICDGSTLWISEELAGETHLSQVNVARLRHARPKSEGSTQHIHGWLTLAGLPRLLAGLEGAFEFGPVRESMLDEVRVWTLVGQWERGRLANLLPKQKEAIESGQPAKLEKLSPQLPTHVVIHVGSDDLFPYRIEYWRSPGGAPGAAGNHRGGLLVLLELYEVRAGTPLDPALFAFAPPDGKKPENRTAEYLERFGLEDTAPAGARRRSPLTR